MSTDAIVLLKNDHKEINRLFKEFQAAGDTMLITRVSPRVLRVVGRAFSSMIPK